jgi:hypothetical protein
MEEAILGSPWFNYYEKLMLWHIWRKASRALRQLVPAQQPAEQPQQPAAQQPAAQQRLTQPDLEWVSMLLADFEARGAPSGEPQQEQRQEKQGQQGLNHQQEELLERLDWHARCADRLWQLHMHVEEVPAVFSSQASLLQKLEQLQPGALPSRHGEYVPGSDLSSGVTITHCLFQAAWSP